MTDHGLMYIGAGLAAIGVGAAALGVGNVFGSFLEGALRNPSAADGQQGRLFIGFAAAELLGLIAFVVAILLMFVVGANSGAAKVRPADAVGRADPRGRAGAEQRRSFRGVHQHDHRIRRLFGVEPRDHDE